MTKPVGIHITLLPHGENLPLPKYETSQSAGMDLLAAVEEDITLKQFERALIPCGFCMAMPEGYEAQVRPRSGLALKHGITLPNTPGTIDADYRGEVKVILMNMGVENFTVSRGMRIAQMVIAPVTHGLLQVVAELDDTARGTGGFGSTGVG